MNLLIRGDHLEVTQALKDYTEKKLSRLEKYFESPPASDVHVTLTAVRGMHGVEVTIPLQGLLLRAQEKSGDMYGSIDTVVDKLERQIRKHKTKVNRKLRQERGMRDLFKVTTDGAGLYEEEDELELVRTKQFALKPMDLEEAILRMNMVGHSFFVFSNAGSNVINVVYKRNDGKYGLIEPAT
ncbi:sigma-54 modulation protein [Paenibacillus swuensis]|uniref:Ribosome hibernation promoting factor n=1 Tax=Paenibacillus swuensis TaxID=1178515 RepID=A0A172TIJ8_9BACL|nr:ribosome-associated translation inhibitor RaiA [Paenibacillus swuensis]ANE46724.1 sigma-54 modulation protein [Paenibacillus swuensis]